MVYRALRRLALGLWAVGLLCGCHPAMAAPLSATRPGQVEYRGLLVSVSVSVAGSHRAPGRHPETRQKTWRWPTQGRMVLGYNPALPGCKGIQISGRPGQAVRAAAPGQVVYVGDRLPGYERLIILKHSGNLLSAYGYLGKTFVQEGDRVKAGQTIAALGGSNTKRPVLHFEIRRHGKPVNPLDFLPERDITGKA
jgi:murein DD-endopeptidase MepM/ murein hydrolase activator NlpD